jgi:hypothetical protein
VDARESGLWQPHSKPPATPRQPPDKAGPSAFCWRLVEHGLARKPAHDAALHFLARPKQYPLTDAERADLIQVVEGYTSPHDSEAGPFCRAHPFRREAAAEPANSKQTNSVSSADIFCAVRETGGVEIATRNPESCNKKYNQ